MRASANTLNRALGYWDLIAYGLAYIAPMAIFSTLGFVWTESRGLIALAYVLGSVCMYFTAKSYAVMTESVPTAGSVYGFARHATAAISLAVALAMRNLVDELASIVNFGALSGFLLLHISVLAKFAFGQRSRDRITHWLIPLAGIAVVLAVFTGMSRLAMEVGISWLLIGGAYGLILKTRHRGELATEL